MALGAVPVRRLLSSSTARHSAVLFVGNAGTGLFFLLASLVASRELGPEDFGRLALYLALATTIVGVSDFGLGTTTIRLVPRYLESDPRRAAVLQRVILLAELTTGLLVLVAGLLLAQPIARLLGDEQLTSVLRYAVVAAALGSAAAFIGPFLVSHGLYVRNALLTAAGALVRLLALLVLLLFDAVDLGRVLLLYTAVPLLFLVLGALLTPRDHSVRAERQEMSSAAREIVRFTKWVFLSFVAVSLAARLDYYLLTRLEGPASVGVYAAGVQLAMVYGLFVSATATVLLPAMSRLRSRGPMRSYLLKVLAGGCVLGLALTPTVLAGPALITLLFGEKFAEAGTPFQVLAAAALLMLIFSPFNLVLYAVDKPQQLTGITLAQLTLTVGLHLLLIPPFGATGAALTALIATLAGGALSAGLAVRALRRMPVDEPTVEPTALTASPPPIA